MPCHICMEINHFAQKGVSYSVNIDTEIFNSNNNNKPKLFRKETNDIKTKKLSSLFVFL